MCFFKMSVGLKKWLTRSGPTSPQYPLQIEALKDSCNNWGSGRLHQISRLIIKHILYFYSPWMEFFISCCYTYFLDSKRTDQQTYLPVEMQFYISVMFLGLPDDILEEKPSFLQFKKNALRTDRRTNGRTDGRTDPLIEMRGRIY